MITIIGTAHISAESVEEVRKKILELKPDVVAVELCPARYKSLTEERDIPLFDLITKKDSRLALANVLLSLLQRRLGEEVGVKPGREMLVGIETSKELGVDFALIDRDLRVTLSRAIGGISFMEKLRLIKELLMGFAISREDIEQEMEKLKEEDALEEVLEGFKEISPNIYEVLVNERDAYMANELLKLSKKYGNIVAVVGKGHEHGIKRYLEDPAKIPDVSILMERPKQRFSVAKTLRYAIPGLIVGVFIFAFYRGVPLDKPVGLWIIYNAIPTFLAVLLVGGSVISALVGMVASPLTSLNPLLAAGWFAGAAEIKVKNVTVGDVAGMFKTTGFKELFRNRAFKVLLVAAAANLGSTIGTFISIPKVILPLVRDIL